MARALSECSGKEDFIARLKEENIDVVMRHTAEGRIYGVTFIDHNTFNVLNGSRLGKAFSANALEDRFNTEHPQEHFQAPVPEIPKEEGTHHTHQPYSDTSSPDAAPSVSAGHSHDNDDYDYDLSLPGFEIQQGRSYNPDEEAFIRRMKRQHRRGRKP